MFVLDFERNPSPVGIGFTTTNWLETYIWCSNSEPPTQFWKWAGSGSHECEATAYFFPDSTDKALAQVTIDLETTAGTDSDSTGTQTAFAKVDNGLAGVYISFPPGVLFDPDQGDTAHTIGNTGVTQSISTTTGAGPYNVFSEMKLVEAKTDVQGQNAIARAVETVNFFEP